MDAVINKKRAAIIMLQHESKGQIRFSSVDHQKEKVFGGKCRQYIQFCYLVVRRNIKKKKKLCPIKRKLCIKETCIQGWSLPF